MSHFTEDHLSESLLETGELWWLAGITVNMNVFVTSWVKQRDSWQPAVLYTETKGLYEVMAVKTHGAINIAMRCECINELKQVQEFCRGWLYIYLSWTDFACRSAITAATEKLWKITNLKPNCQKPDGALGQTVICVGVENKLYSSDSDWGGVFMCIPAPHSGASATVCLHARASTSFSTPSSLTVASLCTAQASQHQVGCHTLEQGTSGYLIYCK